MEKDTSLVIEINEKAKERKASKQVAEQKKVPLTNGFSPLIEDEDDDEDEEEAEDSMPQEQEATPTKSEPTTKRQAQLPTKRLGTEG